jgi:hypothetical protein
VTELAPDEGHITVDAMALALPDQLPPRRRSERSLTTGEGSSDTDEGGGEVQSEAEGAAP